jgi:hypothetical protein
MDRRRFLGGAAMLGAVAAMGPAGFAALRSAGARTVPAPGASDTTHVADPPNVHPPHPVFPVPRYRTVVETRYTPARVPYLAAVARPI